MFKNWATADEIVFRDLDEDGELPGVSPAERQAMDAASEEVSLAHGAILYECRAALKRLAEQDKDPAAERFSERNPRALATEWTTHMKLVGKTNTQASCGVSLHALSGTGPMVLWVWTQARYLEQ
ncbi:MAG: hypothetical protein IT382_14345, partial [Deltaproteobacteria bacterium]|nr:hypothetical protein [Deltaproteobacteria bacterium]